jgi:hypothetical protein
MVRNSIKIIMKIIKSVIILFVISCNSANHTDRNIDFTSQWDTIRVLENPYKGWYHHLLDNGIGQYQIKDDSIFDAFPGTDHIYLRLAWSYLEPKEGKFDWSYINRVVTKYVSNGYKVSFRISCSETGKYPDNFGEQLNGVLYATPSWVEKAGAKGVIHTEEGIKSWIPKWDDPVFLKKLDQFHKAFAARYDGKPWVRYVDIGSIGDWGEGHTASTTRIPPTVSEVKTNVDVYLKNYKKSQLVAPDELLWYGKSDSDIKKLLIYITSKGISLRDDSPLVDWYIQQFLNTWTIIHPEFYDPLYLQKPIVFELQHYRIVKKDGNWLGKNGTGIIPKYGYSGAEIMRKAIELMHATYIGYHGYAEDWLADNPDLTKELANRCGYWYFPVKAKVPIKMAKGENILNVEWLNKGVAPAYNVFSMVLRFEARQPENSFDLIINDSDNMKWLPGKIQIEKHRFSIPFKAANGQYNLMFKLVDQSNKMEIKLGLKEKITGNQGFINLGKVNI